MDRVVIVGAGGFGRELLAYLDRDPRTGVEWTLAGFLDRNERAVATHGIDLPVIGDPETYEPQGNDLFLCAIGAPSLKLRIAHTLKRRGAHFLNYVHPTAILGPRCSLGDGCILCPGAILTTNVTLGDFVVMNVYATAGHDAVIGFGSTLGGHADITGGAKLGEGVFLGSHAVVLPGVEVGDGATLGASSVAVRNLRPGASAMGVPARVISGFRARSG